MDLIRILAIDPGPKHSGHAMLTNGQIEKSGWSLNPQVLLSLRCPPIADVVVIESPQAQDRPLGKLLRDTIWWAGRFAEALDRANWDWREAEEPTVRLWLVGNPSASNSALLAALKEHFGNGAEVECHACHGIGKVAGARGDKKCTTCKARGTMTMPGPLAGRNEHERSAIAVALWQWQQMSRRREAALAVTTETTEL